MMKSVTATNASKRFGECIDMSQREPVIITKQNRPVSVLLSVAELENLIDQQIADGVEKGLADMKAGRFTAFDRDAAKALLSEIKSAS